MNKQYIDVGNAMGLTREYVHITGQSKLCISPTTTVNSFAVQHIDYAQNTTFAEICTSEHVLSKYAIDVHECSTLASGALHHILADTQLRHIKLVQPARVVHVNEDDFDTISEMLLGASDNIDMLTLGALNVVTSKNESYIIINNDFYVPQQG